MRDTWYWTEHENQQSSLLSQKLRAGISMMRFAFLPSNDTQCLQTNMRISARSENRVSTWITLTTHKNCVRLAGKSIFRARYLNRASYRAATNVRSIKGECAHPARYCFPRILARFGTRSIQFGRLRRISESPRAVQPNGAFWSMGTGYSADTRLTNDDDHLHRSPGCSSIWMRH